MTPKSCDGTRTEQQRAAHTTHSENGRMSLQIKVRNIKSCQNISPDINKNRTKHNEKLVHLNKAGGYIKPNMNSTIKTTMNKDVLPTQQ